MFLASRIYFLVQDPSYLTGIKELVDLFRPKLQSKNLHFDVKTFYWVSCRTLFFALSEISGCYLKGLWIYCLDGIPQIYEI